MDFIERLFGISPDAGNGTFEILLFLVPSAIVAALWLYRRAKQSQR